MNPLRSRSEAGRGAGPRSIGPSTAFAVVMVSTGVAPLAGVIWEGGRLLWRVFRFVLAGMHYTGSKVAAPRSQGRFFVRSPLLATITADRMSPRT